KEPTRGGLPEAFANSAENPTPEASMAATSTMKQTGRSTKQGSSKEDPPTTSTNRNDEQNGDGQVKETLRKMKSLMRGWQDDIEEHHVMSAPPRTSHQIGDPVEVGRHFSKIRPSTGTLSVRRTTANMIQEEEQWGQTSSGRSMQQANPFVASSSALLNQGATTTNDASNQVDVASDDEASWGDESSSDEHTEVVHPGDGGSSTSASDTSASNSEDEGHKLRSACCTRRSLRHFWRCLYDRRCRCCRKKPTLDVPPLRRRSSSPDGHDKDQHHHDKHRQHLAAQNRKTMKNGPSFFDGGSNIQRSSLNVGHEDGTRRPSDHSVSLLEQDDPSGTRDAASTSGSDSDDASEVSSGVFEEDPTEDDVALVSYTANTKAGLKDGYFFTDDEVIEMHLFKISLFQPPCGANPHPYLQNLAYQRFEF
ncbi:unnamed protein product, partial [Amoebophrya sp. A25]